MVKSVVLYGSRIWAGALAILAKMLQFTTMTKTGKGWSTRSTDTVQELIALAEVARKMDGRPKMTDVHTLRAMAKHLTTKIYKNHGGSALFAP